MTADAPIRRLDEYVGERVRQARRGKGWLQTDLANRLEELGFTGWRQSKVAKIENGEVARLALDDVIALAMALDVQLPHLLTPAEGGVFLTPKIQPTAVGFKNWLRGLWLLKPVEGYFEGSRNFFYAGPLVPEREWVDLADGIEVAGAWTITPGVTLGTLPVDRMKAELQEEIPVANVGVTGALPSRKASHTRPPAPPR